MNLRLASCFVLAAALLGAPLHTPAQGAFNPGAPQGTGYTVSGRVVCADTQRPARFAQVMLLPASSGPGDSDRGRMAVGRTDLDGRFTLENVPAGDYYAVAEMTGYINDAAAVRNALNLGGDALNTLSSVPRVQVTAGGGSAQLSLQRGAVVSGSVQWDDGSPAAGVQVSVQAAPTTGSAATTSGDSTLNFRGNPAPNFFPGNQTDDRGRFRLSGLAPGAYVVRVNVQTPLPGSVGGNGRFARTMSLSVYAPNKLRKTDAAVLTLAAGEERSDVAIVMGLAGMHTVSGDVSSPGATVRSGSVQLTDQTDNSLNRRSEIGPDGRFTIAYVPPGTYTLRVNASSQLPSYGRGSPATTDATRFQPLQESVTVVDGDLSGLSITVNPATASQ